MTPDVEPFYRAVLLEPLAGARWPPGTDGVRGVVELLAERGSWRDDEVGFTTPDGRDLVVDLSTSYLRDVDGAIAGSVTVSRDITRFASEVQRPIRARRGNTHQVGAAIGIARRRHDDTVDTLLRRAGAAMYQAKRSSNVRTAAR